MKYGYLPGKDYKIYQVASSIDLNEHAFDIRFNDMRDFHTSSNCTDLSLDRDSELEGAFGFDLFQQYCIENVLAKNGQLSKSGEEVTINLEVLSPKLIGVGYIKIHGLCQISVESKLLKRVYCVDIKDGDRDAPLKWYSFTTRKSGLRKMSSAAIKLCVEQFLVDYSHELKNETRSNAI